MNGPSLLVATTLVAGGVTVQRIIYGIVADDASNTPDIITQVGVFGVVIMVAYFFIRRGDTREKEQSALAIAELKVLRDDAGVLRAEILETRDRLIVALTQNAVLLTQDAEHAKAVVALTTERDILVRQIAHHNEVRNESTKENH